jgi:hypothetical protein
LGTKKPPEKGRPNPPRGELSTLKLKT